MFIQTMEATQKVTISLVLPMVCLCLKAIHPTSPLAIKDFCTLANPSKMVIQVRVVHL